MSQNYSTKKCRLNREQKPEVSDTTKAEKGYTAGHKKTTPKKRDGFNIRS
ncbi:MAG: hypothetical protein JWN76_18 [Chitinophagaceae bacterium]|nr:hypothetical protein [Chitinophagaceae bacterium]